MSIVINSQQMANAEYFGNQPVTPLSVTYTTDESINLKWQRSEDGINWETVKAVLQSPSVVGTYEYTGEPQTVVLANTDECINIRGTLTATYAGSYTVECSLKDKNAFTWADGTTANKTLTWEIQGEKVTIPSVTTAYVYNGTMQTVSINDFDSTVMTKSGTESAIEPGTYTLTFTLIDTTAHAWADGTTAPKTVQWAIGKITVPIPSVSGSVVYDGNPHSVTITDFDSSVMTKTGTETATNAATYVIIFSLIDILHYSWQDGTVLSVERSWVIDKHSLEKPTLITSTYSYSGSTITPQYYGYDSTKETVSGNVSASSVGNYSITFSIIDTANYQWADNTTASVSRSWSIVVKAVSIPYLATDEYLYTGNAITPTISGLDSSSVTAGGDTSATTIGEHTITYTLIDAVNTKWSDGTTAQKTSTWIIKSGLDYLCVHRTTNTDDYFYITNVSGKNIQYSYNKATWTAYTGQEIPLNAENKVYLRGTNSTWNETVTGYPQFSFTNNSTRFELSGDLMTLISPDTTIRAITTAKFRYAFAYNTKLVSVAGLKIDVDSIDTENCFEGLFYGCTNLVTPMESLPATWVRDYAYKSMFQGCSSLVSSPAIGNFNATYRSGYSNGCCQTMFYMCSKLADIYAEFENWSYVGTANWAGMVKSAGTFHCSENLEIRRGTSNVPTGWSVVYEE